MIPLAANTCSAMLSEECSRDGSTSGSVADDCKESIDVTDLTHYCAYCGESPAEVMDHVIPKSQGGSNKPSNLVPACNTCNLSKGGRTPTEWLASIKARVDWWTTDCNNTCKCCAVAAQRPSAVPIPPQAMHPAVLSRADLILQYEERAVFGGAA